MSSACAEWRGDIGGYLVGALDDHERARVTRHLARCPGCRAELDSLLPVRDWLSRLAATAPVPPTWAPLGAARAPLPGARLATAGLLPRPRLTRLHLKRPSIRRHALAALVTLAGTATAVALAVIFSPSAATYQAFDRATGVDGQAQLQATPAGTRIDLTIGGLPGGERCTLVAVSPGRTEIAGTWDTTYEGPAQVWGTSALRLGQLTALRVELNTGELLLRIPVRVPVSRSYGSSSRHYSGTRSSGIDGSGRLAGSGR